MDFIKNIYIQCQDKIKNTNPSNQRVTDWTATPNRQEMYKIILIKYHTSGEETWNALFPTQLQILPR